MLILTQNTIHWSKNRVSAKQQGSYSITHESKTNPLLIKFLDFIKRKQKSVKRSIQLVEKLENKKRKRKIRKYSIVNFQRQMEPLDNLQIIAVSLPAFFT